jgi:hypothetical protein
LAEKIENKEESLIPFPYVVDVELAHSSLSRNLSASSSLVDSEVKDVTYATLFLTLFPDTYDIELMYSQGLTQDSDSVKHFSISMTPYYHKKYGGLGIFYTSFEQNALYTNKDATDLNSSRYGSDANGLTLVNIPGVGPLGQGQTLQTEERFTYLGLKYLLPEYKYLPKGANIFYSIMDRQTVYFGTITPQNPAGDPVTRILHMEGEGKMFGFGLHRSIDELPENKVSLHMLQLSRGNFSDFPKIKLAEYSAGVTYKAKNWYAKVEGLIYIAEEFTTDLNGGIGIGLGNGDERLNIPKSTDTLLTFSVGTSF